MNFTHNGISASSDFIKNNTSDSFRKKLQRYFGFFLLGSTFLFFFFAIASSSMGQEEKRRDPFEEQMKIRLESNRGTVQTIQLRRSEYKEVIAEMDSDEHGYVCENLGILNLLCSDGLREEYCREFRTSRQWYMNSPDSPGTNTPNGATLKADPFSDCFPDPMPDREVVDRAPADFSSGPQASPSQTLERSVRSNQRRTMITNK